jgi:hypothetical protein
MKGDEARERIATEPDFIFLKRFDYSLASLVQKHPGGVSNRVVAAALMVTEDDVDDIYENIILKLRDIMKIDL